MLDDETSPSSVPGEASLSDLSEQSAVRIAICLLVAASLNPLNSSMLATAIVPINHSYSAYPKAGAWLVAALYLSAAVAQPVLGWMADRLGARAVLLGGCAVMATGALMASFHLGVVALIVARALIGIGTATGYPCAMSLLGSAKRGGRISATPKLMMLLSAGSAAAAAIGPLVGGILVELGGWKWVFLINLPLAALSAILCFAWLPRQSASNLEHSRPWGFDWAGVTVFAVAVLSLLSFAMSLSGRISWALGGLTIVAVLALLMIEARQARPFIDIEMLRKNRGLRLTYLCNLMSCFALYGVFYGMPQWLQVARGMSPAASGAFMLPIAICSFVASFTLVRWQPAGPARIMTVILFLAGFTGLLAIDRTMDLQWALLSLISIGLGLGSLGFLMQLSLVKHAPKDGVGAAAGLFRTSQYIGAMAAAALSANVMVPHADDHSFHLLVGFMMPVIVGLAAFIVTSATIRPRS